MNDFYVIVAGMGKCGTTIVFNSICSILQDGGFVIDIKDFPFENGKVYKTHDLPSENLIGNPKVIYLFGNPMNIVSSCDKTDKEKRQNDNFDWYYAHYKHLHADAHKKDLFYKEDTMGLENQFDSWYGHKNFPLLTVRYETLFYNLQEIKHFLNIDNINFPEIKSRSTNWKEHIHNQEIEKTYKTLNNKIISAMDVKNWEINK